MLRLLGAEFLSWAKRSECRKYYRPRCWSAYGSVIRNDGNGATEGNATSGDTIATQGCGVEDGGLLQSSPSSSSSTKRTGNSRGINLGNGVKKPFQALSLGSLADSPVEVLVGITPRAKESLQIFHIQTVRDLANWKFARWAEAIVVMRDAEGEKRPSGAVMNIDGALDREHEHRSLAQLCRLGIDALQGISPDKRRAVGRYMGSVEKLGTWKPILLARAICTLADTERTPTEE
uniref:Uncharacterized protein n=1 Tax=Compsopogon caeruleus TaxID=31354 RepID=A0A7S1TBC2_9RHOD|mmetsp:Transcript_15718/g.31665  ORF Transcript_15718/g.31665 Transcript_15718/m.31665 type:complete len:234 (+) Transcript_15718:1275-1976(+)